MDFHERALLDLEQPVGATNCTPAKTRPGGQKLLEQGKPVGVFSQGDIHPEAGMTHDSLTLRPVYQLRDRIP